MAHAFRSLQAQKSPITMRRREILATLASVGLTSFAGLREAAARETSNDPKIAAAVRAILDLRADRPSPGLEPMTPDQGYDVQDELDRALFMEWSWARIGYKVGATSADVRAMLKLDKPFYGRLYEEAAFKSAEDAVVKASLIRRIEIEIAVQIARDLKGESGAYDSAMLKAATKCVAPAIEITGSDLAMGTPETNGDVIADFAGNACWILGESVTDFAKIDLDALKGELRINDQVVERGVGADVDGGPFGSAAFLANSLNKRGQYLRAGDWISTGTLIKTPPAAIGQKLVADFGVLGKVETTLVAKTYR